MQFTVDGGAGSLDIGDVEQLTIGAPRKARAHRLTHPRAGAVATGEIRRLKLLGLATLPAKPRLHAPRPILEADQFGPTLHADAQGPEPVDEQALVLVLRIDEQERVRRQASADGLERDARRPLALDPQVDRR